MDTLIKREEARGHSLCNSTPGRTLAESNVPSHPLPPVPLFFLTSPQPEGRTRALRV